MSNTDGLRVWVGDLDDYIDIDAIDHWNEQEVRAEEESAEKAALRNDIDAIGNLPLLNGCMTSASALDAKGITPDEWRWAVHEAEKSLPHQDELASVEGALIQGLLAIGRPYAIGRHARWERLPLASARTAVQPFGHLALIDQQLAEMDLTCAADARRAVRAVIRKAEAAEGLVAYERTALVRTQILRSLNLKRTEEIDRERIRILLSLTRLRFTVSEANVRSFGEFRALDSLYAAARQRVAMDAPVAPAGSKAIRNWSLRHLHPLTFMMPIAIRAALGRGAGHMPASGSAPVRHPGSPPKCRIEKVQAVNELALAQCATILLRRAARQQ